jgi:hypothetical protein
VEYNHIDDRRRRKIGGLPLFVGIDEPFVVVRNRGGRGKMRWRRLVSWTP